MNALNYIFDGTADNFRELVIENSHKGVVLVNYWTPNAGPCFKLWQVLEKLSTEYQGRFLLVNINTEGHGRLARDNGITSVPTVKVYQRGEVVDSIYGAHSETSVRETIDKYVRPKPDPAVAEAIRLYQAGAIEDALALLAEASRKSPDNVKLYVTALKLLLREKRYSDLETCYRALPEGMMRNPELSALQVHAFMLQRIEKAPSIETCNSRLDENPGDMEARVDRAALAMAEDDFGTALEHLLLACRTDRNFAGELPRRAMLAIFQLLGEKHALTAEYQKKLLDALH